MRSLFNVLSCLCVAVNLTAQSFYDSGILQEIKITFFQDNWDFKLDSLKNIDGGDYLLARSVEINGELFDSVGVKYKGNSSYSPDNMKNPLHIELNFIIKGQDYQGIKDIKLNNGFADPTFVREALSYQILRQYMDAPLANHAKVWINGVYWGVYGNVESVNKRFVKNHFFTDGDNPFFKCNPEDFGGPGTGGNFPDLVYSSADSAFYYNKYDIQSDIGWLELMQLMDTLKNHPNSSPSILDLDRALWMLAFNNVMVNLDSYTGAFGQNYYLYHDKNERWLPIIWDLNMSFGAFPLLTPGGGAPLTITQMKQLDPLAQSTNNSRPLIKQLLVNPRWKKMYLAHLRTIAKENFSTEDYKAKALALQANISAAVQSDTKKFYPNTAFTSNITQTYTGSGAVFGTVPGITDLMNSRYAYLNNNINLLPQPPIYQSPVETINGNNVTLTINVQETSSVWFNIRYDSAAVFSSLPMYDDGQHNDGAAADGVFGISFILVEPLAQYYFYAENTTAGAFLPERAEHEFFLLNALPAIGQVVINEFMAENTMGAVDESGEYEDWVELYNNTTNAISLKGVYLSDDVSNLNKWTFPQGTSIPANGFIIVWLDENGLQGPYHANFKLKASGEAIYLSGGNASAILDSHIFGAQEADKTTGRYPNGTGPYVAMPPTFDAFNSLSIGTQEPHAANTIKVHPNPANDLLFVKSTNPFDLLQVTDIYGRVVLSQNVSNTTDATIFVGHLNVGTYCLRIGGQAIRVVKL